MKKLGNARRDVAASYEHGCYVFKLGNLLLDRDISMKRFMRETGLEHGVVKKYMRGEVQRVDLGVLEKIMHYFGCESITDIIEYREKQPPIEG